MAHNGRVHVIGTEAEEKSGNILAHVPRELTIYNRSRRPIWYVIEFEDTQKERDQLTLAAIDYNSTVNPIDNLVAHGTHDSSHLCQILIDSELRHVKSIENYGGLDSAANRVQGGGYWDKGWGLFVTTPRVIQANLEKSQRVENLVIPLNELRAILFPSPIVEILRMEFPDYSNLIKGYLEFTLELEHSNGKMLNT